MPEQRKRETAYKLRIGDILRGTPIVEDIPQDLPNPQESFSGQATKERFRFLELGEKRVMRVNVVANIIDKFVSEGEKRFSTITIDDASGQIRIKVFGEDVALFEELSQGDTILIIGVLRSYNKELYILPEIIKKIDPRYLLVRKLELEKELKGEKKEVHPEKKLEIRDQIIEIIKAGEQSGGVSNEDIILKITTAEPAAINSEIIKLIEDGTIYEPRPGKVRYLG